MRAIMTALRLLNPRLKARYSNPHTAEAVAVIAGPFNRYLWGDEPDETNKRIAEIAARYANAGRPFIGQYEQTSPLRRHGVPVVEYPSKDGEWVQTHVLMRWVAKEVTKFGRGNVVLLIGHPHHVRRVAILARHYGLDPRVVPESEGVPYDSRKKAGSQWWCRSVWRYVPWEYLLARPKLILDALLGRL